MRLIDADKLIEKLRDFKEYENDDGRPIHTMSEIQMIDRCINFAQAESTAYDVDKVVSELQDKSFERYGNQGMGGELVVNFDDAVEIVKRGGVDESK